MSKILLTFHNALIEKKYKLFKVEGYRPMILTLLVLLIIVGIYQMAGYSDIPSIDYILIGIYMGIAVFSLIMYKKLPKVQYIVVLVCGLLAYFTRIHFNLENPYKDLIATPSMRGYNWALLYMIIQLHFPHFKYIVAFEIGTSAIRYSLVSEHVRSSVIVFQVISVLYLLFMRYMMERSDRIQFLELNNSINHLEKFKELIKSHLPSGILVMESVKMMPLFLNDQFKAFLNNDESQENIVRFLKSIKQDKEQLDTSNNSTTTQGDIPILFDTLSNFSAKLTIDSDSMKVYGSYQDANEDKRTIEVSLLRLPWDGSDAVALVLNDNTVQESIISLKAANSNKERVLSTVSHELRTPVGGMIGILQIMEGMCSYNPEMKKYVNICQTNANILLSFLNSILDLQQIRANKLKLNISKINLMNLLNDIKPMFDFQCSFKDVDYILDVDPNVPKYIFCDKERLTQILINLSGNALKFTFHGTITLRVSKDPDEDNSLKFQVSDTGVGIKEEDLGNLFKAFGKLDDKEGINKKGVGLGLMISNTLVKLLSKNKVGIKVESEINKGTTFYFSVPILLQNERTVEDSADNSIAEERQADQLIRPIAATRNPNEILPRITSSLNFSSRDFNSFRSSNMNRSEYVIVVDDNSFNLMIAEKLIEKQKIKVKKAYNGQEAIELIKFLHAQGEGIRLIFMDCHMPIMDGYEATGKLRSLMKSGELPYIPIVALSANNYEQDVKQSLDAGMDDHMCKPLNEHELVRILDKYNENKY